MISSYYSVALCRDTPQKENEITVRTKSIVLISIGDTPPKNAQVKKAGLK